jgi:hypothetical protein
MPAKPPPKPCMICGAVVCKHMPLTDAGKRMSEIVGNVVTHHEWDELVASWMAFSLEDGSSDGVLYPTRRDAILHQRRPEFAFYLRMRECRAGLSPRDATILLSVFRIQRDRGRYHPDPDSDLDMVMPLTREHLIQPIARVGPHSPLLN